MNQLPVRVRFAPSPTGPLHIGGVRTALYNYLFAKKNGGQFILRIEDTDQTRFVPGAEEYIIESLTWCGILFDEGVTVGGPHAPYRQSERKPIYRQYADQLVKAGYAYYAFDTEQELEAMRERLKAAGVATPQYNAITRTSMKNSLTLSEDETKKYLDSGAPYVIRIKIPRNEEIKVLDIIRGWVVVHSSKLDDKVLFKSDGMPTYHLANVVDDYLMKISHVIRGEEWLPSAPLHVLLYRYLGWEKEMPQFAHLPLLLKPDGNGKLSKRDGDRLGFPVFPLRWTDPATKEVSSGYRESGYFPEAFINMLAFLGWNPGTTQEFFSMEELVAAFSLERVGKSGSKFDFEKAKWFNQQYLKAKDDNALAQLYKPILKEKGINYPDDYITKVCGLVKDRATFVKDFWDLSSYFFVSPTTYDKEMVKKRWKEESADIIDKLKKKFAAIDDFSAGNLENKFHEFLTENNIGSGAALAPLRLVITGMAYGPSMFETIALIGKEETTKRMSAYNF